MMYLNVKSIYYCVVYRYAKVLLICSAMEYKCRCDDNDIALDTPAHVRICISRYLLYVLIHIYFIVSPRFGLYVHNDNTNKSKLNTHQVVILLFVKHFVLCRPILMGLILIIIISTFP